MEYGVRFCGGCNPRYDRGNALETIREKLKGKVEFPIAEEGVPYDGILVIGGCSNCCAAYEQFQNKGKVLKIWDEKQIQQIIEQIEKEVS